MTPHSPNKYNISNLQDISKGFLGPFVTGVTLFVGYRATSTTDFFQKVELVDGVATITTNQPCTWKKLEWTCLDHENGVAAPVRYNASKRVVCASYDGKDCFWENPGKCLDRLQNNFPTTQLTLECSDTITDAKHWCPKTKSRFPINTAGNMTLI